MLNFPDNPGFGDVFDSPMGTFVWDAVKWLPQTPGTGWLPLSGGTLSGPLTLPGDPTAPLQATTKQYTDTMLPLAGGVMVGGVTLAGVSTAPLAAPGNNTAQIASTAFVTAAVGTATAGGPFAPLASPTFTGTVTIPAGAAISGYAPLASPAFTGTPLMPTGAIGVTQTAGNSTTALATTAFVAAAVTTGTSAYLPLTGGALTGGVSAPTMAVNTTAPSGTAALTVNGTIAGLNAATGSGGAGGNLTLIAGAGDGAGAVGTLYLTSPIGPGTVQSLAHFQVGSFASQRFLTCVGPTLTNRAFRFATAPDAVTPPVPRWQLAANSTAETGSNTGSDLDLSSYTDAGGFITNALIRITRASGVTTALGPVSAFFLGEGVSTGLALTGTTQATALALIRGMNIVATVPAGSGATLPAIGAATVVGAVPVGTWVDIFNTTANVARIYGAGTQTIDGAAAATGVPLSGAARCRYFAATATTWVSALMGGVSA